MRCFIPYPTNMTPVEYYSLFLLLNSENKPHFFMIFTLTSYNTKMAGNEELRIVINGLSLTTSKTHLEAAFSRFGPLLHSQVIVDKESGHSRAFGFVTFADPKAMAYAIRDMDGEEINGKVVSVKLAKPRPGDTQVGKESRGYSTSSCPCSSGGCRFPPYPDHGVSSCKKDDGKELYLSLLDILPMDIISDILIRLPVKSLLCLKCVCKSLFTLISSSKFARLHLRHSQSSISNWFLIFTGERDADYDFCCMSFNSPIPSITKLPFPEEFYGEYAIPSCLLIGSCNGLVCVNISDSRVVVVNPSTRTFCEIPESHKPIPPGCGTRTQFGFGYDAENDDYKLVRIHNVSSITKINEQHTEIMVYSLKAKAWRLTGEDNPWNISCFSSGVLIDNHLLHWNACHRLHRQKKAIFVFNLSSEQYSLLPVPDYPDAVWSLIDLGNLEGSLSLLVRNYVQSRVDVWVMKQYGAKESWVKLLGVSDPVDTRSVCNAPIIYGGGGLEILLFIFNRSNYAAIVPATEYYSLCWYNLQNNTMRDFEPNVSLWFGKLAFCWKSLVSIPGAEKFSVGERRAEWYWVEDI